MPARRRLPCTHRKALRLTSPLAQGAVDCNWSAPASLARGGRPRGAKHSGADATSVDFNAWESELAQLGGGSRGVR
eukprot:334791-Chlamydomonas_euryale.AAC.1